MMETGVINNQGTVNYELAQKHISDMYGSNAILVGIKSSIPDMLNGWRADDIRFDWINKTDIPELNVKNSHSAVIGAKRQPRP